MLQRVVSIRAHFTSAAPPVLFSQANKVVQVTLNKPKGLNAIDVEMISLITNQI
jgi:enoyl-CoA hydratase/carnithine racemase